ncbi:MAG: DUF72 domain-containing protein [Gemmatimonadota bacterium]
MVVQVGMSGYAYQEWKGTLYPADLPADGMLAAYAGHFPTVEINSSFYRMPSEKVLLEWASRVPEGFSFALKASRRITHNHRLKDVDDLVSYVIRNASVLGGRLGPMLFQLPPTMKKDLERLRAFLTLLPREWKIALEWRHSSWDDAEVHGLLGERGVAAVTAEFDEQDPPIRRTADWGYLRLHRPGYTREALAAWADRIRAQGWERCWVYFQHEEAVAGPQVALDFQELTG